MSQPLHVTVGPEHGDFIGTSHLALQAAVERVSSHGGGTVEVLPGTWHMNNALHLRDNVRLVGCGEKSVLLKSSSASTPLAEDMDWYEWSVTVTDPDIFEVGGGIALQSNATAGGRNVTKHTVLEIAGNRLRLDSQPRKDHWITHEAVASTLFPIVTANWTKDLRIENITLDGNRDGNDELNGNYGGCIFMQDCEHVHIEAIEARNNNGDGISFQVCHDVTVVDCHSHGHARLGLHPGSGSQRPVIRGNRIHDCGIGLFWCWGVMHGLAENNEIRNSREFGISIGHRDTDNVMRHNCVYDSGLAALIFRDDPPARAAHRNVVESNLFENAGSAATPGIGIDVSGPVDGLVLRQNRIFNSTCGHLHTGIRISAAATNVELVDNHFENVPQEIEQQ